MLLPTSQIWNFNRTDAIRSKALVPILRALFYEDPLYDSWLSTWQSAVKTLQDTSQQSDLNLNEIARGWQSK